MFFQVSWDRCGGPFICFTLIAVGAQDHRGNSEDQGEMSSVIVSMKTRVQKTGLFFTWLLVGPSVCTQASFPGCWGVLKDPPPCPQKSKSRACRWEPGAMDMGVTPGREFASRGCLPWLVLSCRFQILWQFSSSHYRWWRVPESLREGGPARHTCPVPVACC